jgi:hypothetical protein
MRGLLLLLWVAETDESEDDDGWTVRSEMICGGCLLLRLVGTVTVLKTGEA